MAAFVFVGFASIDGIYGCFVVIPVKTNRLHGGCRLALLFRPYCYPIPRGKLRGIVGSSLICLTLVTLEIPEAKSPQVLKEGIPNQGGAVHLEPPSHAIGRAQQIFFDHHLYLQFVPAVASAIFFFTSYFADLPS